MKKVLFKLVTSGIIIVPSCAMIIACGNENKGKWIKLVTGGGSSINDKSFNEQGFDALKEIYKKLDLGSPLISADALQPDSQHTSHIMQKYSAAFNAGAKVILAPGYHHVAAIKTFNKRHGEDKLKFILADSESTANNVAGIVYDTKSAGFLAGVLSGLYLKAKNDLDPQVGTFGGGSYPGVTNFMTGWVQGIKWYTTNYRYSIKFYDNGNDDSWTNTEFAPGGGRVISNAMVEKGVDIILPVAGPQTADALAAAKKRVGGETMIIGVDTNQKLKYPSEKKYLLTSIMKNVKDSLVQVWQKNYVKNHGISDTNIKKGFGKTSYATLDNKLTGMEMTETTTMMKNIYAIVKSSKVQTAAKSEWVQKTTWKESLKYIQTNLAS